MSVSSKAKFLCVNLLNRVWLRACSGYGSQCLGWQEARLVYTKPQWRELVLTKMSSNKAIVYSKSFHLPAASTKESIDECVAVWSAGILGLDQVERPVLNFVHSNRPFDLNMMTAQLHACLAGELGDFNFAFTVINRSACPLPEWEKDQASL